MAKLSVSLDDDLADELRDEASENVSAFVAQAVRDALDRRKLLRALADLDNEFGELDDDEIAEVGAVFDQVEIANRVRAKSSKPSEAKSSSRTARR